MSDWIQSRAWTLSAWLCLLVSVLLAVLTVSGVLNSGGGGWGFGAALTVMGLLLLAWLLTAVFSIVALQRREPGRRIAVVSLLISVACILAAMTSLRF